MNTGRNLGPHGSARSWLAVGLTVLMIFISFVGDFALSVESDRQLRAPKTNARISSGNSFLRQQSPQFSNHRLQLEGKMSLGSQFISSEQDEGANAAFGFGLKFDYKFIEWMKLKSETELYFSQERFQTQIDDDRYQDGFSVREAVVAIAPVSVFELGLGAVNQKNHLSSSFSSNLLISNRSFPGLYEEIHYHRGENYIKLRFNQSIPTSRSFDANRSEKEETPYFYTETLSAGLRPNKHILIEPFVMHYRYENLPSVVAFDSAKRGNTVPNAQPTDSKFAFEFDGFMGGMAVNLSPTRYLSFVADYHYLENSEAPENYNKGQLASIGMKARYKNIVFSPAVASFFNESDTAPASYNSGALGHNNREGMLYHFDVRFENYNFKISTEYVVADRVNPNDLQADLTGFSIMLETLYVTF